MTASSVMTFRIEHSVTSHEHCTSRVSCQDMIDEKALLSKLHQCLKFPTLRPVHKRQARRGDAYFLNEQVRMYPTSRLRICADVAQYQVVNKWLYAQWSGQVEVWCPVMGRLTGGNRGGPKCAKFACWTASIHDAYLGIHEHNISQGQPRMPSISRATS
ncbi:hypothetical protein IG631_23183 [Alternaria alternata]|nr:hypothetical protein IG631_23183 [Alternaria alternata]